MSLENKGEKSMLQEIFKSQSFNIFAYFAVNGKNN